MEIFLLISYLIVAFLFKRSRLALGCLIVFLVQSLGYEFIYMQPDTQHIFYLLVTAPLLFFGDKYSKVAVCVFIVFQYLMAWDAFLSPNSATFLYSIYQNVSFVLHLAIITTAINNGVKNFGKGNSIDYIAASWLFGNKSYNTRNQSN